MSDGHVCIHKHARLGGSGACSPRNFSEIRCSEIASEVTLDRSRAVVAT